MKHYTKLTIKTTMQKKKKKKDLTAIQFGEPVETKK